MIQQRVTAMLAAYEAQTIDADELHGRLLKAIHVAGSGDSALGHLNDLLNAVDEATDLATTNARRSCGRRRGSGAAPRKTPPERTNAAVRARSADERMVLQFSSSRRRMSSRCFSGKS